MSVVRSFIAIDLPLAIRQRLEQVTTQLTQQLESIPVRWVPAENIHLTLKFLGDVSVANVEMLKKILQSEADSHHRFEISIGGLGAFPNNRQPRVIWVGVEAPSELASLQRSVDTAMAKLGYNREERPFSPHLTLGRVSRNTNARDAHHIGEVIEAMKIGFLGVAPVEAIHLYKSDLRPTGSVYTRMFSAPLK